MPQKKQKRPPRRQAAGQPPARGTHQPPRRSPPPRPPASRQSGRRPPPQQPPRRPRRAEPARSESIRQVQKHRRQKRKRNYTLYYILLFLFLSTTGIVLSLTVFFNIESIRVEGSALYGEEEVLSLLEIKTGDNLLRVDTGSAEDALLGALTRADSVKVSRSFPNALTVTITDGVPSAQLSSGGQCFVVSQSGRILSVGSESEPGSGILIMGVDLTGAAEGDYVEKVQQRNWEEASALAEENDEPEPEMPDDLQNVRTFFAALRQAEYSGVTAVDLTDSLSLTLYWENRIEIQLGSFSELSYKLAFAKTLLTDPQYADIITPESTGVLDVQDTASGVQFFPSEEMTVPGDGVSVWNWDDGREEENAPEGGEESSPAESSAEEPAESSAAEETPDEGENPSSLPAESAGGEPSGGDVSQDTPSSTA